MSLFLENQVISAATMVPVQLLFICTLQSCAVSLHHSHTRTRARAHILSSPISSTVLHMLQIDPFLGYPPFFCSPPLSPSSCSLLECCRLIHFIDKPSVSPYLSTPLNCSLLPPLFSRYIAPFPPLLSTLPPLSVSRSDSSPQMPPAFPML